MPATFAPSPTPAVVSSGLNDLFELSTGIGMAPGGYVAPKAVSNTTLCGQDLNYSTFNICITPTDNKSKVGALVLENL